MDQSKDTTFHQKGKHFSKTDRRELQGILRTAKLLGQSLSLRKLAKLMHCAPNTIRNELKRGAHPHTGHYGAARAQRDYNCKHQNSCTKHKRFVASPFVTWAIQKVKQFHWSLSSSYPSDCGPPALEDIWTQPGRTSDRSDPTCRIRTLGNRYGHRAKE